MKIFYCSPWPITFGTAGPETALASIRYRAIIPFSTLTGVLPPLCYRTPEEFLAHRDDITGGDLVIIGKNFGSAARLCLKIAQDRGAKTIFDLCDNYFAYEKTTPSVAWCAKECTVMTVSTEALAAIVRQQVQRDPLIITDPYEGPEGAVRPFQRPDRLEMTVFCGRGNLTDSIAGLEAIVGGKPRDGCRYAVTILSEFHQDEDRDRLARLQAVHSDVTIQARNWSREGVCASIAASDIVLLPGSDHAISAVKSPNRLVEGVRGGRWVIAHPFPSYRAYSAFAAVTSDYSAAIAWARANPQKVQQRIQAGQAAIRAIHDPAIVGQSWLAAIQAAIGA